MICDARLRVMADEDGHLPRARRLELLDALGPHELRGRGHRRRVSVAMASADRARSYWVAAGLSAGLLDQMREAARRPWRGDDPVRAQSDVTRMLRTARDRARETGDIRPYYAALAEAAAARVAIFDAVDLPERVDDDLRPEHWDVELCAVNLAAGGTQWGASDTERRVTAWMTWLDDVARAAQ